jgi:hypothetical protein
VEIVGVKNGDLGGVIDRLIGQVGLWDQPVVFPVKRNEIIF